MTEATPTVRKTALVTGGTGAVGSHVCRLLAEVGHNIAFTYSSNHEAAELLLAQLSAMGITATARAADLSNPREASSFVDDSALHLGGIDVVVHAGGPVVPQRYVSNIDTDLFAFHVANEVSAFFNLVTPALGYLRASQGAIVAVTSVAIRHLPLKDALSSAPKAGIEALVRAIAKEEGRFGIRANSVGPGILEDGMAATLAAAGDFESAAQEHVLQTIPLRRFGTAQDVADAVAFLVSERARYISGQTIDIDGGYGI
jgi:3-oxoacyl-[acyl-carrier protein] reductase